MPSEHSSTVLRLGNVAQQYVYSWHVSHTLLWHSLQLQHRQVGTSTDQMANHVLLSCCCWQSVQTGSRSVVEDRQRRRWDLEVSSQRARARAAEKVLSEAIQENKRLQQRVRQLEVRLRVQVLGCPIEQSCQAALHCRLGQT